MFTVFYDKIYNFLCVSPSYFIKGYYSLKKKMEFFYEKVFSGAVGVVADDRFGGLKAELSLEG